MNSTGWLKGLRVSRDGTGIVSHAGVALVRALVDNVGLTAGLSKVLASRRLLVHDRGRVLADLACAIADGAEVISDFRVIGDQEDLCGLVASVPTAWRTLDEIARGGERALGKLTAAVNAARRRAWAAAVTRHGALPGVRVADKTLDGVTCIRLDATVVACHSGKEGAEPNFGGFGLHPLLALLAAWRDPNVVQGEEILVAEMDGRIVGCVTVEDRGRELELVNINVPPELQGRGIGTMLVRSVEERARAAGKQAVTAGASRNAAGVAWKSLPWWQHLGYRVTHEEESSWTRSIGSGAREIRMRKELPPP